MSREPLLADRILDSAIVIAESSSWENLHLHQIARQLGVSLADIYQHFTTKDDLVQAWYARADRAMLRVAERTGFYNLNVRQRLHALIMGWLDFLAVHKQLSYDMLWYKFEPAHFHLQIQGLLRVSMTVQWIRDAAGIEQSHLLRILEETGLTQIYLLTFFYWMFDRSADQRHTRLFLDKQLKFAEIHYGRLSRLPVVGPLTTIRSPMNSRGISAHHKSQ